MSFASAVVEPSLIVSLCLHFVILLRNADISVSEIFLGGILFACPRNIGEGIGEIHGLASMENVRENDA